MVHRRSAILHSFVAPFEPVDVPSAGERRRRAVARDERTDDVALAVCDVAVDLAGVRRDVVEVLRERRRVLPVRPLAVLRSRVHDRPVLVDAVGVVDARHQLDVVAIVATRLAVDAIEDVEPVLHVLHVAPELLERVVIHTAGSATMSKNAAPESGMRGCLKMFTAYDTRIIE